MTVPEVPIPSNVAPESTVTVDCEEIPSIDSVPALISVPKV